MEKERKLLTNAQANHLYQDSENFERQILDDVLDRVATSEMSEIERYFLNGIIRHIKPQKILEVGVAAGGSSAIILNATRDIPNSVLFAADYLDYDYHDTTKKVGFTVYDRFPEYLDRWKLFTGGDVSKHIEQIGDGIDFALIDTAHVHPVETLNFLCVLPFLKLGSWVVLHDVSSQWVNEIFLACKYLFGHVSSGNKLYPTPDAIPMFANIGAFQITEDTYKNLSNVFMSLTIPWGIWTENWKTRSDFVDFDDISKIIKKYYNQELYEIFEKSVDFQIAMRNSWGKMPFSVKLRNSLRRLSPRMFYILRESKFFRSIKNKITGEGRK